MYVIGPDQTLTTEDYTKMLITVRSLPHTVLGEGNTDQQLVLGSLDDGDGDLWHSEVDL